jgi:hypothetical protein
MFEDSGGWCLGNICYRIHFVQGQRSADECGLYHNRENILLILKKQTLKESTHEKIAGISYR